MCILSPLFLFDTILGFVQGKRNWIRPLFTFLRQFIELDWTCYSSGGNLLFWFLRLDQTNYLIFLPWTSLEISASRNNFCLLLWFLFVNPQFISILISTIQIFSRNIPLIKFLAVNCKSWMITPIRSLSNVRFNFLIMLLWIFYVNYLPYVLSLMKIWRYIYVDNIWL